MKRLIALALSIVLAACASPRTASIQDGKITGITGAEATTLAKADLRQKKVDAVQKAQKPIVRMVANQGQPITINAAVFEVYVPMDEALLLAEQPSETSENVQLFREVRGMARETFVPLGLGAIALTDRNRARASAERIAAEEGQTERARLAAQAAQTDRLLGAVEAANERAAAAEAAAAAATAVTTP